MHKGHSVCSELIDGLLYPEEIGRGKTNQELLVSMTKSFIDNGLVLNKCTQKKA